METSRSSIGVELEFLVAVAEADQELNVPTRFENSTGAPIILEPSVRKGGFRADDIVQERVQRTLKTAVAKCRGTRVVESEDEVLADPEAFHLSNFLEWNSGSDGSVFITDVEEREQYMNDYQWYPCEISSAALWATEDSFEEIRNVVDALKTEYWILTPSTAGMHWHYGNGKEYIPFEKLRRMAALLVAVDPLITQLHPEHRRVNDFCLSNRLYSRVAHGRPATVTAREIGAEYVEAPPEFPGNRPQPEPVDRPFRRRTANLIVPFKRGQLTGYEFDDFFIAHFNLPGYEDDIEGEDADSENRRPLGIPFAVREILRCTNAPTVAELMRYSPLTLDRPAYSFRSYTDEVYKQMVRQRGEILRDFQHKRTIEFRQMASTMEPDEVVAHGKVVVRLCEAASVMSIDDLYGAALDCTVAEVNGRWFDVFDLLAELGLESEAKVLQYAVARFRGETVPETIVDDQENDETDQGRTSGMRWLRWLTRLAD